MNSDWLIDFLVKIDFKDSDNRASGIIVKLDNFKDNFFVFTAKHTFEDEKKNIIINKDKFSIFYQNENEKEIKFKEYVILKEDIIVFIFDNSILKKIKDFDFTVISSKKDNFGKCIFRGYPRSQLDDGSLSEPSIYIQTKEKNQNLYQIRPDRKNTDTIDSDGLSLAKGFSGSGLFIEEETKYALVGIIKEHEKNLSAYNYIALAPLMDEVIEKLSSKCNEGNPYKNPPKTVPVKMDDGRTLNVSIYPVTFGEYDLFCDDMEKENSFLKGYENKPVVKVDWNDANEYCIWLSKKIIKRCKLIDSEDWEIISLQDSVKVEKNIYEWCFDGNKNEKILKINSEFELVDINLKNLKIGFRYTI
jgi:hypothetical protein